MAVGLADGVAASSGVASGRFVEALRDPRRVVINVHTPDEGSIQGTDLAIPFDQLRARADELPAGRAAGLAVYCMSGNMSETAVETLTDLGYLDVIELRRGMEAWKQSGRPLVVSAPICDASARWLTRARPPERLAVPCARLPLGTSAVLVDLLFLRW